MRGQWRRVARSVWAAWGFASILGVAPSAQAANIVAVSPQGEAARVQQVVVRFNEGVVPFGALKQADPVAVACQGGTPAGSGRWSDARTWLFDFRDPLPPGLQCSVALKPGWQAQQGPLTGNTDFSFSTGAPSIDSVQPGEYQEIEEGQHFLLTLTGPVAEASLAGKLWCEVQGIGERLPVRVISGPEREAVLKAKGLTKIQARVLMVACGRPLPHEARMRLVWGPGIAAAANPKVLTKATQHYAWQVRRAFVAEFSCERERANAPCLPIRPMTLRFSAPVPKALAQQVRLKPVAGGNGLAPLFDKDDKDDEVSQINFPVPLAENASYQVELPAGLKDVTGRTLATAASYPRKVATGGAPPLAKFAAAPFGVIERESPALVPVTLRHVQGDLKPAAATGQVRIKRLTSPTDVLAWLGKVSRFHETQLTAEEAGRPRAEWKEWVEDNDGRGKTKRRQTDRYIGSREISLLASDTSARRMDLPALQGGDPRPFEVIGIPLTEPGYHVLEIESGRLGQSLLASKAPMYVRTGILVTNLGVHFKHGRESSLAWVTSLDRAQPVAGADVTVHDCTGKPLWRGTTDGQGRALIQQPLEAGYQGCVHEHGLFITASKADAPGTAAKGADTSPGAGGASATTDLAFVFSTWDQGIEPWRFNLPTNSSQSPDQRAHTVFDRSLLRAGETVSMKHFLRTETASGLAELPANALPDEVRISHIGSGQEYRQPLVWRGSRSASSSWAIPAAAKLGLYRVTLRQTAKGDGRGNRRSASEWDSGEFRVEEFRLPLVDARLVPPKAAPVAPNEVALQVQLSHLSGGALAQAPLRGSAVLKERYLDFPGYEAFTFSPPREAGPETAEPEMDDREAPVRREGKLVADKVALVTGADGSARFAIKGLPKITRASELMAEVSFNDPNGEVQTIASTVPLWPSAVVLGIRTNGWAGNRGNTRFTVVALNTAGQPMAGQKVEVRGQLAQTISHRKRLVGGFYAYDNRTEMKPLGSLCSGQTDAHGLLACEAKLETAGQVGLVAQAADAGGNAVQAGTTVWVTRQGELWFEQGNDDRIDVLAEKKRYEPGETARLQVRMPFREATALVAIEREGVIDTRVLTLHGDDPTVELKIEPGWAPNVYVSVLAVRGRIREVPWYSFFNWGWKEPINWARAFWVEGKQYTAPTALVDLSKPGFKLGVAALQVGQAAHTLQVKVMADKPQYTIRQQATVKVQVLQNGQPVPGAEVAFAAVDEGLLALRGNDSWNLLGAMIRQRDWGVATSTAHSEIIGKRHFGRKAVAAGGGGGRGGTRELFDTLLLWQDRVVLDAKGEATLTVPLNDALTSFRLVAVADAGVQQFGTGSTSIRVTQDLQVLSGLPPLVREGDRYTAMLTLRNTTAREMKVRASLVGTVLPPGTAASATATATGAALALPAQEHTLAAGSAKEIAWAVDVPAEASAIRWLATVQDLAVPATVDKLKVTQAVVPAVPLRVQQATLAQLDGPVSLNVAPPADALQSNGVARGGITAGLQPRLSSALPGIRRYFETYPYSCLEQKTSKALALHDTAQWQAVANALPTYLDSDGLASYFPPRSDDKANGSDRLTAYLLAATHEAGLPLPPAARDAMLDGLAAFVTGRIERKFWSPKADLDVRKLAAIEALARYGKAQPRLLGSVNLTPQQWPTAAVIDWLSILQRLPEVPDRARRLDEARQILRARLSYSGTTLRFSNEADDYWWWLMDSPDSNAARLILTVLDDPLWKDDLPRLVTGHLARQERGAWRTTTANLWGALALDKFSARFESVPVSGRTVARLGAASSTLDWGKKPEGDRLILAWPGPTGTLTVSQEGKGKPWLTVQSLAAVPLKAPVQAGYTLTRTVTAIEQKDNARFSRGDVLRVRLQIDAASDRNWVVVADPVPGGASLLGGGGGRDSALATQGEKREGSGWPAYEERSFEAYRAYFAYLPAGRHVVEYTVRLNNAGRFALPPSRVEAMYAPETFGEVPIATLEVAP